MKGLDKHKVFFVGIGGIGMSALARWFNANGYDVIGYDKTATVLTQKLMEEGILVHYEDSLELIPDEFNPDNTLVIFTPAIPKDHKQLNYFKSNDFEIKKRAEVLGMISRTMFTIAVAGTHGKTTTSSMIAHILNESGVDTTAFLGGIATNLNSNLLLGNSENSIAVIEADEYDRSFLHLSPNIAVITSTDPDHLDIYGDEAGMLKSYIDFTENITSDGKLFISTSAQEKLHKENAFIYGDNEAIRAENLRIEGNRYKIDYISNDIRIEDVQLNLPGQHNLENALAAITVALEVGVSAEKIKDVLIDFRGIKRRFEYIIDDTELKFIDDYAHHPKEVSAFIQTLKALYPEKFIQVIFQPHLFSRTQDFAPEFAESLSLADNVVLMDIYPARELPIPGVTSALILDKIDNAEKQILSRNEIIDFVLATNPEVLATVGAGNIDTLVPELNQALTKSTAI